MTWRRNNWKYIFPIDRLTECGSAIDSENHRVHKSVIETRRIHCENVEAHEQCMGPCNHIVPSLKCSAAVWFRLVKEKNGVL